MNSLKTFRKYIILKITIFCGKVVKNYGKVLHTIRLGDVKNNIN